MSVKQKEELVIELKELGGAFEGCCEHLLSLSLPLRDKLCGDSSRPQTQIDVIHYRK